MAAKGAQCVIVDIDVGGTLSRTTRQTLLSDANSMLAKTFDPNVNLVPEFLCFKGWGQSAKLKKHSRIWGKFGTAIQGYILNPCTKFPPNPTSKKVNNQELTSQHHA